MKQKMTVDVVCKFWKNLVVRKTKILKKFSKAANAR